MTLTNLLGIKRKFLRYEHERGLRLAELRWTEKGSPVEPRILCDTLDAILDECMENGVLFPPILLKRKKQLDLGIWKPEVSAAPVEPVRPLIKNIVRQAANMANTGSEACPACGGWGFITKPGGFSGSLCSQCMGKGKLLNAKPA